MLRPDPSPAEWIWIFIVVAIVGITTIPRLGIGYGSDGDATRSVEAAMDFLSNGVYKPSRMPGNPLFEYLLAVIVPWGGCIGSNLFIFSLYLICIGCFSFLVKERDNRLLLTFIFALTPILLVNAVTTMDYIPGLALLLGCYIYIIKDRYILAGIFLGLSIGFRITNVLFILPVSIFSWLKERDVNKIISFCLLSIFLGLAFYIPIFLRSGLRTFMVPHSEYPIQTVIYSVIQRKASFLPVFLYKPVSLLLMVAYQGYVMLFGPFAAVGIGLVCLVNIKNMVQFIKKKSTIGSDLSFFILEITTLIVFTIIFILHPDESAYMLPAIPFFYLLISRWVSNPQMLFIGILIISFNFININFSGKRNKEGQKTIEIKPDWGVVVTDYTYRKTLERLRNQIFQFDQSDKAVILTNLGSELTYGNKTLAKANYREISSELKEEGIMEKTNVHKIKGSKIYLVYALSGYNVNVLQNQGYKIYKLDGYQLSECGKIIFSRVSGNQILQSSTTGTIGTLS